MVSLRTTLFALAAAFVAVDAAGQATCGANSKCPSSTPCCSQYGECGTGAYCLGGCDPEYSFDLNSCMAAPVCQSGDFKMDNLDDVVPNTKYLGDASTANWVSSGTAVLYQNSGVLLTMAPSTVGTLLSSTHYVWYGKISATMTTSQGAGVVTAFIMMSDVKDEIDFEFVGVDLEHAQSNYYFQGITDYDNEMNLTVSNTVQNTHTYTIDWQPDYLSWSIDGKVMRTKFRNETYNSTTGQYHYPQSPSRVQLSLWPAGLQSNGAGTVSWAGGLVDWNSQYMSSAGYYYALVNDVNIQCYDPPSGYQNKGTKAYKYQTTAGTNDTVAITNDNTILGSFQATGDNQSYDPDGTKSASASGTKTSAASAATSSASSNANTVPGFSGAGSYSDSGDTPSGSASGSQGSSDDSGSSSSSSSTDTGSTSFDQGLQTNSNSNGGARVVAGGLVALVAFFAASMML